MKVSKYKSGSYIVTLHDKSFDLEKTDAYWTLSNHKGTEVNRAETKSGLLELMACWSPERTEQESRKDSCDYA